MTFSLSDIWFRFIHSHFLIYNTCWEDSVIDRKLLQFDSQSDILVITSAGDNALDYLLENPASLQCVDVNPKQNALLELKIALIKYGDFETFFEFFGHGKSSRYMEVYSEIRSCLSANARDFWDHSISYFGPKKNGFYYQSGAGIFARFLNYIIKKKKLKTDIAELIQEENEEVRIRMFNKIEKELWRGTEKKIWKTAPVLSLAGIPESQRNAIKDLNGFIKKALYNVFVSQGAKDNYHWRVYLSGSYSRDICPDYLKSIHFKTLRDNVEMLRLSTGNLSSELKINGDLYSHFVLLDHMDWLADDESGKLEQQWQFLLQRARPKAKFLFRTAFPDLSFLPETAHRNVHFEKVDPSWIAAHDKVGTYPGTYLGELR